MLGVLARQTRPLARSCSAMSVKVPPISTATASDDLGEAVDIRVTMKGLIAGRLARSSGVPAADRPIALADGDAIEAAGGCAG